MCRVEWHNYIPMDYFKLDSQGVHITILSEDEIELAEIRRTYPDSSFMLFVKSVLDNKIVSKKMHTTILSFNTLATLAALNGLG